jgi:uncharacterized protein
MTTPRSRPLDPRRLDVRAFADAGAATEGTLPQHELARLAASVLATDGASPVAWRATGEQRPVAGGPPEIWLHLHAQTQAVLQCQRCLQPMAEPVEVDRRFRFVASEAEAERLDEELDDDVLVLSRHFDLVALLEDELILALPLVPRHDTCPEPLPLPADDTEDAPAENPFAALAHLRRPPQ